MIPSDQIIEIDFDYLPGLSYALYQNHVPVIRRVQLTNSSSEEVKNLEIRIDPSDDFGEAYISEIDSLLAGAQVELTELLIRLNGKFFASLTERMRGSWKLTLISDGQILFERQFDVELFAFDQWLGSSVIPEMLAAFVLPNIPELTGIVKSASNFLKEWSDSSSFDDYQSKNPNRVKTQMAAIFAAIKNLNIIYNSVPASFGKMGQRLRLPDAVLSGRIGNCLDMSLLYASALESVGLHPILVLIEGHAFVGAWLVDDTFPDAVNDDASLLTKRRASGIHEILLLEATCLNEGNAESFDSAVERTNTHFLDLKKFNFFIDVKRSRFSSIYPMPQRKYNQGEIELTEDESFKTKMEGSTAPNEIHTGPKLGFENKIQSGKQNLWERKLLDLSLRNNLLNLRLSKSSVQFIDVPVGELEDALSDGAEFQILHKPKDWENTLRDEGLYQAYSSNSPLADLVHREFGQKRLRVYLTEEELNSRLTFLYRNARQSMEENGANTLYLAIGLLKWYESPRSEKPRFAPILLIPVELIRKSVKVGFVIRGREEETVMNITLLEKLRQDFQLNISGLDPLPTDSSGVDVKVVFNNLRQAVMNLPRWDVEEQFFLGTFSFNKFILWNDIHTHTDQLKKSPIVEGLLEGKLKSPMKVLDLENLDIHYKPSDILLPIDADSSQLEAVCASVEGDSFILHGPPGTGKSQTITNIIANALYRGKRVLFVAEKMAALSVVHSRLQNIGLDPFCLELHSNKARKAEVLAQLKKATEVIRKKSPDQFEQESNRINSIKGQIDVVYQKLHQEEYHGFSLFELLSKYTQLEKIPTHFTARTELLDQLSKDKFSEFEDFVLQLEKVALITGGPGKKHPFFGVKLKGYSQNTKFELSDLITEFLNDRKAYFNLFLKFGEYLDLKNSFGYPEKLALEEIAEAIVRIPDLPDPLFEAENLEVLAKELMPLLEIGFENQLLNQELMKEFEPAILNVEAEGLLRTWKIKSQEWFLPRFFGFRKIRIFLQSYSTGIKIEEGQIVDLLEKIKDYQGKRKVLESKKAVLEKFLTSHISEFQADWQNLKNGLDILLTLDRQIQLISGSVESSVKIRRRLNIQLKSNKDLILLSNNLLAQKGKDNSTTQRLSQYLGVQIPFGIDSKEDIGFKKASLWKESLDLLKEWHAWILIKEEARKYFLDEAIVKMESLEFKPDSLKGTILKGTYRGMAVRFLDEHPELSIFSGEAFESRIEEFKKLNKKFAELTKEVLFAKLASGMPDFSKENSGNSETGILQRAIKSNGRGQSIRQLFKQIPNLLPRISPCMLMSPISVAQYVDIHQAPFDLVIFDEASQMPTCEAVGAIARGKQLIIVGDPKQMPPTNFFSSIHFDEEDQNEDLESILDDCEALSVPSKQLKWHYRSKHESLIAFSNAKFYENSLFTFPSPDDLASRVKFVSVKGVYDRGRTRQNKAEAVQIVDELVSRIKAPKQDRKSVGVVTFSSVQQTLIEDLLMEKFRDNPKLEELAAEFSEPYFIKNLENVQGDERDVILFSVCYGPDESGYVALNFGPLNRDGGWRRLNVAVSRARYEMIIYSTLHADQIDLSRSKAAGVAGLKAFLVFADKGRITLPVKTIKSANDSAGPLAQSITEFLRSNGYDVDVSVGASGFKVDVAVVNPESKMEYLLGILLDSKAHESSKSSIDRILVQQNVLRLLGWNIHKVWSLEWWESQTKAGGKILDLLDNLKIGKSDLSKSHVEFDLEKNEPQKEESQVESPFEPNDEVKSPIQDESLYHLAELEKTVTISSDEFLAFEHTQKILEQIRQIVEIEAPILKSFLAKRLLDSWGISRMGGRIQSRIDDLLNKSGISFTLEPGGEKCLWKQDQKPEAYSHYRVKSLDGGKRNAEEIPVKEVMNAMVTILQQQISLPEEDLIRETAKEFGFARTGSNVQLAVKNAIKGCLDHSILDFEKGRYLMKK